MTVCATMVAAMLAGPTPGGAAAEEPRGGLASLVVTPGSLFIAGQQLTFEGNLGVSGVRTIHLEQHMGRIGDSWGAVEGFKAKTKQDGSFKFTYPAPSMFDISMRVAGGKGIATPDWGFDAKSQDLTLSTPELPGLDENEVLMGIPFSILVDTTPTLVGRPDLPPPPIAGRKLTLQRRVDGDSWETLATSVTGLLGNGAFLQSVVEPGYVTYRVRQEDWNGGGDQVGWYPSFPFTIRVVDPLHPNAGRTTPSSADSRPIPRDGEPTTRGGQTAAKINKWGVSLWDFAWTYGESLTSKPARGTDRNGWWLDSADGSGRVSKLNGQLVLDSGRNFKGDGDMGTTRATLHANPATYGRWETAFRIKRFEAGAGNYHAVLELVPDRASDYRCGTRNITVADIDAGGKTLDIGVRSPSGSRWTSTLPIDIGTRSAALGIEVAKRHITWFVDGKTVGVLRVRSAVPKVPMTPRLSLVGDGTKEMNHTQLLSDWERGWSLDRGKQVTKGPQLKKGSYDATC